MPWKNLWGLDFKLLERDDWIYVVTYYGLRVSFVLVLMILAWTVSSWAFGSRTYRTSAA